MPIILDREELQEMLEGAAKVAVAAYIRQQTPAKDRISQNKAYKMFGESRVKGWVNRHQIFPLRDGDARNSTRYYSITELQTLVATEKALYAVNRRRKAV